jgi:SAM-dependent methyltransferase
VVDLAQYRQDSLATWDRMATGWENWRQRVWDTTQIVGQRMVAAVAPQPGQTILEVAAGLGDTGYLALERIGAEGKLISTDFAPEMVAAGQRRADELGLGNVEHRVLDAERMDLEDDSVDGALCRWGYMLMADPAQALGETRRVLKPGGRLCFSVWATPDRNMWAAVTAMALVGQGHMPAPEPGAPGIFAMGTEDRIRELVGQAGFGEPTIEDVPFEWEYESFDDYWAMTNELAGPLARVIAGLSDEDREAVKAAIAEQLGAYSSNGGYAVAALTRNVTVTA